MKSLFFFSFMVISHQANKHCHERMYECTSDGTCISRPFVCDGDPDCLFGEDERECFGKRIIIDPPSILQCDKDKPFACKMKDRIVSCIEMNARCDGVADCPEKEDERNCDHTRCPFHHVGCNNGICIPDYWICDGSEDCSEGEDEQNCHKEGSDICKQEEFRCREGKGCLSTEKICDGKRDCPFGDDEEFCQICDELQCSFRCRVTDGEAHCICPEHSKLLLDGRNCSAVDICDDGHGCQHYCNSNSSSFFCSCETGYSLRSDKMTCEIDGLNTTRLIVSSGKEIRKDLISKAGMDNFYDSWKLIFNREIRKIAYARTSDKIFFITPLNYTHSAMTVVTDKDLKILKSSVKGIHSVAFESISQTVYYTTANGIFVCSETDRCVKLWDGTTKNKETSRFAEIALDSRRGLMYYVQNTNETNRLMTARLNGQQPLIIEDKKLEGIKGLSLDPISNHLYFGDYILELIEMINLNSMKRSVIHSEAVHGILDLIYFNGALFWTEDTFNSARFLDLRQKDSNVSILHHFHKKPFGLSINHPGYNNYKNSTLCSPNRCLEVGKASAICVPIADKNGTIDYCLCPRYSEYSEKEKRCIIHSEKVCKAEEFCLNGGVCTVPPYEADSDDLPTAVCSCPSKFTGERCHKENTFFTSSIFFLLIILIVVLVLSILAYLIIRVRKRQENPHQETSISFVNRAYENLERSLTEAVN